MDDLTLLFSGNGVDKNAMDSSLVLCNFSVKLCVIKHLRRIISI